MMELICFYCSCHIGWITDSGPIGLPCCDSCKDEEDEKDND